MSNGYSMILSTIYLGRFLVLSNVLVTYPARIEIQRITKLAVKSWRKIIVVYPGILINPKAQEAPVKSPRMLKSITPSPLVSCIIRIGKSVNP